MDSISVDWLGTLRVGSRGSCRRLLQELILQDSTGALDPRVPVGDRLLD